METQFTIAAKVYSAVLNELAATKTPLTVREIHERPNVFSIAKNYQQVYDAIKSLHNKGQILKYPNTGVARGQWAYLVNEKAPALPVRKSSSSVEPKPQTPKVSSKQTLVNKPEITITNEGIEVVTDKFKFSLKFEG